MTCSIFFSIEFWAAIVGAVVGGGIAAAIQLITIRENRKQRERASFERDSALGRSLFIKFYDILSLSKNIFNHLDDAQNNPNNYEGGVLSKEPWEFYKPLANLPKRIVFTIDEKMILLSLNRKVFSKYGNFDDIHNGLVDVLEQIRVERSILTDNLPASKIDGDEISTDLTIDDVARLRPRMILVNNLVNSAREYSESNLHDIRDAANKITLLLNDRFGFDYRINHED